MACSILIFAFGAVSGGHFNPAVTIAALIQKKIDAVDSIIYILAQLSGAVLGALFVKGILEDEGSLCGYGNAEVSDLLPGDFAGAVVEGVGTFLLVTVILAVAMNPRARQEWAPLGDRRNARLRRDDLRPADRRLVQPGPLVRPGADRRQDRRLRPPRLCAWLRSLARFLRRLSTGS